MGLEAGYQASGIGKWRVEGEGWCTASWQKFWAQRASFLYVERELMGLPAMTDWESRHLHFTNLLSPLQCGHPLLANSLDPPPSVLPTEPSLMPLWLPYETPHSFGGLKPGF